MIHVRKSDILDSFVFKITLKGIVVVLHGAALVGAG